MECFITEKDVREDKLPEVVELHWVVFVTNPTLWGQICQFLKLKTPCYYTADHRETNILPDCRFPQHLRGMDQSTAECS